MEENSYYVQDVYNKQGELLGIYLSREVWELVGDRIKPILEEAINNQKVLKQDRTIKEPWEDWNLLKQHWDFKYELTSYVYCENCSNCTQDWEKDDPRKFKLTAANLGGLVTFECMNCSSKIIKRHFKDYIKVETVQRDK